MLEIKGTSNILAVACARQRLIVSQCVLGPLKGGGIPYCSSRYRTLGAHLHSSARNNTATTIKLLRCPVQILHKSTHEEKKKKKERKAMPKP